VESNKEDMLVAFPVSKYDRSNEVRAEQLANIEDISVTRAQVNADGKVSVANFVHPWNIEAVVVRSVELNVESESEVMFEQFANIDDISVTFPVLK
jgi:hypothetical protein